jgi:DNA polymerase-1
MSSIPLFAVDVTEPTEHRGIIPKEFELAAVGSPVSGLVVALGKKAAEKVLGRSVNMRKDVGERFTLEDGTNVVVQHHPLKVVEASREKGGEAERTVESWCDVWEFALELAKGDEVEVPDVVMLLDTEQILTVLQEFVETPRPIAYDYETWGDVNAIRPELNAEFRILSIGLAFDDAELGPVAISFPVEHPQVKIDSEAVLAVWSSVLASCPSCAHNVKYEHKVNYRKFGKTWPAEDTMLASYVLEEAAGHSLSACMKRFGIRWGHKSDGVGENPIEAKITDLLRYNGLDALATLDLKAKMCERMDDEQRGVWSMENEFSLGLARLETTGIAFDRDRLAEVREQLVKDVESARREVFESPEVVAVSDHFGREFNPNSNPMMQHLVFKVLKEKVKGRTKSGSPSLDKRVLEKLEGKHPVLRALAGWRSKSAMVSGFIDKWSQYVSPKGLMHGQFSQAVTMTGRLSSTEPNFQNVPKNSIVKSVFVSRSGGWLVAGDYAQQEPRLVAGISGDEKMKSALNDGLDLHRFAASEIFSVRFEDVDDRQRDVGKRMNLGIIYGQTEYGLAQKTGLTLPDARALLKRYDVSFPGVARWKQEQVAFAVRNGYVRDLFGSRRHLPDVWNNDEQIRQRAYRQAGNSPIQSTAAKLTMLSLCMLQERLFLRGDVIMQIHDSIVIDVSNEWLEEGVETLKECMLIHNAMHYWEPRGVPFKVDLKVGRNLKEMQDVK